MSKLAGKDATVSRLVALVGEHYNNISKGVMIQVDMLNVSAPLRAVSKTYRRPAVQ